MHPQKYLQLVRWNTYDFMHQQSTCNLFGKLSAFNAAMTQLGCFSLRQEKQQSETSLSSYFFEDGHLKCWCNLKN